MTARNFVVLAAILLISLLGSATAAQAIGCDTWYGPGSSHSEGTSGSWGEAANWSAGVPESSTKVCITLPGTYTVTLEPFPSTHYAGDVGGAAEDLTLGAASGTQTLQLLGKGYNFEGDWYNQTVLGVLYDMTVGAHGKVVLDATELNASAQTGEPHGGGALLEQDTSGQGGHSLVNEGTIQGESSSSRWSEGIHSHSLANHGSLAVNSGTLTINSEETSSSTGSIATAAGATLQMYNLVSFTNEGSVSNAGTTILDGHPTNGRWIQGHNGSVGGNPVEIEYGGGLEDTSSSGAGAFAFGISGGGYLIGTVPAAQTIDVASTSYPGSTTLSLAEKTLTNEGTINLDVPSGAQGNTNIEIGALVNRGVIRGTVENGAFKNVIDVPVTNEAGGVIDAASGVLFDNRPLTNNGRVEVAPSSSLELVATTLANGAGGVMAPQIAGPAAFGRIHLNSGATVEAAGTLAPTLVGGFKPSAGEEFDIFQGAVKGTFGSVTSGFTGDYSHATASPPYVGVIYGAVAGGGPGPVITAAKAKIAKVTVSAGRVTLTLSCPAGTLACGPTTARVTVTEHVKVHRRTVAKTVVLASGTVSLKAGAKATLKLRINSAGKALLRIHRRLKALVTLSHGTSRVASETVTLRR